MSEPIVNDRIDVDRIDSDRIGVDQIDRVFDDLERIARQEKDFTRFVRYSLEQLALLTEALIAEFCICLEAVEPQQPSSPARPQLRAPHRQWIRLCAVGNVVEPPPGEWLSQSVQPARSSDELEPRGVVRRVGQVTQFALFLERGPDQSALAAIVLTLPQDVPESVQPGILSLVQAVSEVCSDHHRRSCNATRDEDDAAFQRLLLEAYASESVERLAQVVAHDCPNFFCCERAAVLQSRRGAKNWTLLSVTGSAVVNRGTDLARAIEEFTAEHVQDQPELIESSGLVAVDRKQPLREAENREAENSGAANSGAANSGAEKSEANAQGAERRIQRDLLILPFAQVGARRLTLWLQWGEAERLSRGLDNVRRLFPHLSSAARLCDRANRSWIPFHRLLAAAGKLALPAALAAILAITAIATCRLEADFFIEARGFVEPVDQRMLFATHDGFVDEVYVDEGQLVEQGERLVKLRSPDLTNQLLALDGDIASVQKRRDGFVVAISQSDAGDLETALTARQMAAEVQSLDEKLDGLSKQRQLILKEIARLDLASPIGGSVVSWDARQSLESRPVRRGDVLLRVADLSGPWKMRLWVSDKDLGHVLEADQAQREVTARFKLFSRPGEEFPAQLASIGTTVQSPDGKGPAIPVDFHIDRQAIGNPQVGSTTQGRIDCGKRYWWYVWGRGLAESLQRRFWVFGG